MWRLLQQAMQTGKPGKTTKKAKRPAVAPRTKVKTIDDVLQNLEALRSDVWSIGRETTYEVRLPSDRLMTFALTTLTLSDVSDHYRQTGQLEVIYHELIMWHRRYPTLPLGPLDFNKVTLFVFLYNIPHNDTNRTDIENALVMLLKRVLSVRPAVSIATIHSISAKLAIDLGVTLDVWVMHERLRDRGFIVPPPHSPLRSLKYEEFIGLLTSIGVSVAREVLGMMPPEFTNHLVIIGFLLSYALSTCTEVQRHLLLRLVKLNENETTAQHANFLIQGIYHRWKSSFDSLTYAQNIGIIQ